MTEVEIGLDTAYSATVAPVRAALLTGDAGAQGRGTPGDEIRDATVRTPNLWFGGTLPDTAPNTVPDTGPDAGQRFHVEVYVPPEVAAPRLADSEAPSLVVVADQDDNRGVICFDASAVPGA